jgi:hypothetical protein
MSIKDPAKVRAGQAGAASRWGEYGRIVRLDDLTTDQARLVRALIDNMTKKTGSEISLSEPVKSGGTRDASAT